MAGQFLPVCPIEGIGVALVPQRAPLRRDRGTDRCDGSRGLGRSYGGKGGRHDGFEAQGTVAAPGAGTAAEEIAKLITYLDNNRDRLGYDDCQEQGFPIGSGGIESANKYISHARLKRSGAWWVAENGNNMLRLRCAMYNGTFDQVFRKYILRKHQFPENLGTNA